MLSFACAVSSSWVAPGGLRPAPLDKPRSPHALAVGAAADLEALGVKGLPIEKTVLGFQMVPDQKLKYQQLLFLAKKLPDMDEELCVDERRVPGCLSTVYVHCTKDDDGLITFQGTSDAQLTKGLVALLVNGLSGCTNEQIQGVQPAFIEATGLQQSLTPGRNNGFLNMLAMMKRQAAALDACGDECPEDADTSARAPPPEMRARPPSMLCAATDGVDVTAAAAGLGPVGARMVANLAAELSPTALSLVDESDQHAGHAGAKGFNGESHFALTVVSSAFDGVRSLKRHQMVYAAVGDDMPLIHALSIKAMAPGEPGADEAMA